MTDKTKKDPLLVVDHTKNLTNLTINASFITLIQNVLLFILRELDPKDIVKKYSNIDKAVAGDKDIQLTDVEAHMYTCTTLVQYLRNCAQEQDALIEHEQLEPKDLEPALKAFRDQDYDSLKKEVDILESKVKPVNAD